MSYLKAVLEMNPPVKMETLNREEMEALYAGAYGLYEVGDYQKGGDLFTRLILQDPFQIRFWKGLASCRQMQKEYQAALHAWSIVCILDKEPRNAHFHAAECLASKGDKKEAIKALLLAQKGMNSGDPLFEKIEILKRQMG